MQVCVVFYSIYYCISTIRDMHVLHSSLHCCFLLVAIFDTVFLKYGSFQNLIAEFLCYFILVGHRLFFYSSVLYNCMPLGSYSMDCNARSISALPILVQMHLPITVFIRQCIRSCISCMCCAQPIDPGILPIILCPPMIL